MARNGTLRITIAGDHKPLEKSMDKATDVLKDFAKAGPAIFAGLGIAAGAVFVSEFGDAVARGKMQDKLAAQLNLTEAEAEKAGKIAGDLYVNAYGDSLDQVYDAVGAVMSSLGDLDDGQVEDLTAKALDLAAAFDVDVNESVTTAGVLLRTGLAKDGDQAFDLIVRAMQKVPSTMRGELLPILEEYAQDFAALGITGEDAFGLLVEAAGDGRYELDKTADALKELTIRASDMSTASVAAYDALGLNAAEMSAKIVRGGDDAREAFDLIIDGLLKIEDPAEQANTAIALMGTPLEDLSVTEIPAFLERLADMDGALGTVEGAAEDMGNTLNDNAATKIESFKRRAGAAISTWAYENVLPAAEEVIAAFEEDGVGGAIDKAIELWEQSQPAIRAWWHGTFVPFWQNTAIPWMAHIGGSMAAGMANAMLKGLANALPSIIEYAVDSVYSAIEDVFFLPDGSLGRTRGSLPRFESTDVFSGPARPGTESGPRYESTGPGGRFHDGGYISSALPRDADLRHDERRIIAQVGEKVVPVSRAGRAGQTVVIPVMLDGRQVARSEAFIDEFGRVIDRKARRNGGRGL